MTRFSPQTESGRAELNTDMIIRVTGNVARILETSRERG